MESSLSNRHTLASLGVASDKDETTRDPILRAGRIVQDAMMRAREIESEALARAEKIENQARSQAAEIIEQAKQEGAKKGEEAARERVEQLFKEAREQVEMVMAKFEEERRQFYKRVSPRILELAFALVERLLRGGFAAGPELLEANLKDILEEAQGYDRLQLKVNLQQLEVARALVEDLSSPETPEVDLVGSASVEPGGVVAEGPQGRLEALPSLQLESLREAVQDE